MTQTFFVLRQQQQHWRKQLGFSTLFFFGGGLSFSLQPWKTHTNSNNLATNISDCHYSSWATTPISTLHPPAPAIRHHKQLPKNTI
jgi:hypothetical protein